MELSDEQVFQEVRKLLFEARGVDLSGYSRAFVMRCIRRRVGRSGSKDFMTYIERLHRSEDEVSDLIGALSINVTEFFRDEGAFESFSEKVIRPLLASKSSLSGGILRMWSAGCATGQEAYTLAMCALEQAEAMKLGDRVMISIYASDLSKSALDKARDARYSRDQVKNVPPHLLAKFFVKTDSGYEVSEPVRKRVRFGRENLLEEPKSKFFDAIVCRNVLIYFARPTHDKVAMNLYNALKVEGYLMLGKTETLMGLPRDLLRVIDAENRIYLKVRKELI